MTYRSEASVLVPLLVCFVLLTQSYVFCAVFCGRLFVLAIVLYVLRIPGYSLCIIKFCLILNYDNSWYNISAAEVPEDVDSPLKDKYFRLFLLSVMFFVFYFL